MSSVGEVTGTLAETEERGQLQVAAVALRSDRVRAAHELYADALEAAADDETRAEALEGLGHVAHRSGRPREALRLFEDSLRLSGKEPWDRLELAEPIGRSYAAVGEIDRATTIFLQCVRSAK